MRGRRAPARRGARQGRIGPPPPAPTATPPLPPSPTLRTSGGVERRPGTRRPRAESHLRVSRKAGGGPPASAKASWGWRRAGGWAEARAGSSDVAGPFAWGTGAGLGGRRAARRMGQHRGRRGGREGGGAGGDRAGGRAPSNSHPPARRRAAARSRRARPRATAEMALESFAPASEGAGAARDGGRGWRGAGGPGPPPAARAAPPRARRPHAPIHDSPVTSGRRWEEA